MKNANPCFIYVAVVVIVFIGVSCGFLDGDPEVFLIKDSDSSFHLQWTETLLQQRIVLVHGTMVPYYVGVAGTELVADKRSIRELGVWDEDWREVWWYDQDSVTRYRAMVNDDDDGGDLLDADGNKVGDWWLEDGELVLETTLYGLSEFLIVDIGIDPEGSMKWFDVFLEQDTREARAWWVLLDPEEDYSPVVVDKTGNQVSGFSYDDLVLMKGGVMNTAQNLVVFPAGSFRSDEIEVEYRFLDLILGYGGFMFEVEVLPAEARSQVELPNQAYWAAEVNYVDEDDHMDLLVGHPFQPYDVGEPSKLTFAIK